MRFLSFEVWIFGNFYVHIYTQHILPPYPPLPVQTRAKLSGPYLIFVSYGQSIKLLPFDLLLL